MAREPKGQRRQRAVAVDAALQAAYPHSTCALDHDTPFQLLVATMLSAQTTDLKVNQVTPELFARYPGPDAMAEADPDDVGRIINSIGLWRGKAKNVVAMSRVLVDAHDGRIPETLGDMVRLPGVGRKTATAVLGTALGVPAGVTVDTHMLRIHRLLRLVTGKAAIDPDKLAKELEDLLPRDAWSGHTHRVIDHGRLVCVARRPRCGVCVLQEQRLCPSAFLEKAGYKPSNDERVPASAHGLSWLRRRTP